VLSGDGDAIADAGESSGTERDGTHGAAVYRSDGVGTATRLIDVLRGALAGTEITAGSKEISAMVEQMYRFQETALASSSELHAAAIADQGPGPLGGASSATEIPTQDQVRSIKSQQTSLSREREKAIQGMQSRQDAAAGDRPDQQDGRVANAGGMRDAGPSTTIMFGLSTSFCEAGKQVAEALTLNRRQRSPSG
jgi:hypothetical protein